MADFHIEVLDSGSVQLRPVSEAGADWVATHRVSAHRVTGGLLIERGFVDGILADIARDGLIAVHNSPLMYLRR